MTRVLYVGSELPARAKNAGQVRARNLLPALDRMVTLRVIAYPAEGDERADVTLLPTGRIQSVSRRGMSRVELALATLIPTPRAFLRFDTKAARAAINAIVQEHNPEIIHLDSYAMLGLIGFIREIHPDCLIVAQTHDAISQRMKSFLGSETLLNRAHSWVEYRKALYFETCCLGKADLILVDSDEDRDYLRAASVHNSVETLPLGFSPAVFSPEGSEAGLTQPAIVFSGSMKDPQSVDAAIFLTRDVMPLVWQRQPEAHLYIVGGGSNSDVQSLADHQVHVTGYVEDLAAYLRASAVYACPLRIGAGMRTRVVEALACGATMVATPMAVRGLQVHQRHAPWVGAESAVEFAREILRTIEGANSDIGAQASAYAREYYSWESVARQLVEIYKERISQ